MLALVAGQVKPLVELDAERLATLTPAVIRRPPRCVPRTFRDERSAGGSGFHSPEAGQAEAVAVGGLE